MASNENSKKKLAKDSKPTKSSSSSPWPKRSREEYELLICTFLDSLLADAVRPLTPGEERVPLIKKH
jgi:hypothetical protein